MKKVLVTGATGFIGRHCLSLLLSRGYEVHATTVDVLPEGKANSDILWHRVDLLDPKQTDHLLGLIQPAYLLHFAWYTTPVKYWTSTENLRWMEASIRIVRVFTESGGRRIVMAGSCAEYDWRYGYCVENLTPLIPTTLYGICKNSLQMIQKSFCEQAGVSSAWGRIFFLYGPYEHPSRVVPSVIRSILNNEPALCSHGNQIRDFLYVEDVADAFVSLLDSNVTGTVNIASGEPVILKNIIYEIADQLNRHDLIQLGMIKTSPAEVPFLVADTTRLTNEVGWHPAYNRSAGIARTIDWWRSQH